MNRLTLCYLFGVVVGAVAVVGFLLRYPNRFDAIPAGIRSAVFGLLTVWGFSDGDLFAESEDTS